MKKAVYNDIFGSDGAIARVLEKYEYRQSQVNMAFEVEKAISGGNNLIVEAGTGIGKTFAYLIPFIQWSYKNDKRVVISTYTKTLQEQLVKKDLPFLHKALALDFRYALCVGSENYLCLRRLDRSCQQGLFDTKREAAELQEITEWAGKTETGLRLELDFEPQESVWVKVCREPDLCRGKRCARWQGCFYAKARALQAGSHLLVANHHLFFADIAAGRQILPSYEGVVFDEAHNLEEAAASHLGFELSNTQLKHMIDEFHHPKQRTGFFNRIRELKGSGDLVVMANASRQAGDLFFSRALDFVGGKSAACMREPGLLENILSSPLEQLADAVTEKMEKINDEEDREDVAAHVLRIRGYAAYLSEFVDQKREQHVYWVEAEARPKRVKCSLCASPVDIAPHLKKLVFDEISPVVLTSATISVNGSFEFVKKRLGIESCREILLHSPFDFEKQVILYAPKDLPDPAREEERYVKAISEQIEKLINITQGRTFVLFTSYDMLRRVYDLLKVKLSGFEIMRQGDFPRWQLLEKFKKSGGAVLFATSTFWQGVDVPGKALENVIITRLPFAVPDHPLIEARILDLERKGEDAFMSYQVPRAVLLFKQGFGRLIRRRNDVGIAAILDPRIRTRNYGRFFLDSLPRCREIDDINELAGAYASLGHKISPSNERY
jgi:ATP-dependent DNA helicase DinG